MRPGSIPYPKRKLFLRSLFWVGRWEAARPDPIPLRVAITTSPLSSFSRNQTSCRSHPLIFHYMIFAHNLGMYDNTGNLTFASGISEDIPADSFIVALGHYAGQVGTSLQQAGTFMHELGHNLGLHHGGQEDTNYKPNYLSVMNYLFQMPESTFKRSAES